MQACLLRFAGHDLMDFRADDPNKGGSDGCIAFQDPGNVGLDKCLQMVNLTGLFEKYCDRISFADFSVILAEHIIGEATLDFREATQFQPGSMQYKLMKAFRYGRKTSKTCPWAKERMPDGMAGCYGPKSNEEIFFRNVYKG